MCLIDPGRRDEVFPEEDRISTGRNGEREGISLASRENETCPDTGQEALHFFNSLFVE